MIAANTSWYLSNFRAATIRLLVERGWDVHVIAPDVDYQEVLEGFGARFHQIRLKRRGLDPFSALGSLIALYQLYRRVRPSVIHNFTIKMVVLGGLAGRLARVNRIVSAISGLGTAFHGGSALLKRLGFIGLSLGIRPGNPVVFQNPEDHDFLIEHGIVRPTDAFLIRGSGVDPELFSPPPAAPDNGTVILYTACRMLWAKGIRELMESVALCRQKDLDVRLRLLGEPDPGNPDSIPLWWLEQQADKSYIDWLGFQENVRPYLLDADIVVTPSYSEGLPKMLLEGAAMGKPLIASDIPGCREIVHHGETGFLVTPRDRDTLAEAIATLAESSSLRGSMGREARRLVVSEFTESRVAQATVDCYEKVLS